MATLPSSLGLTNIADGASIIASDHRNNYSAVQTAVNALIAALAVATAKGDMVVATASGVFDHVPVGSNGQVLTADSTQTAGMKWGAADWQTVAATLTYSSTDGPTFVVTTGGVDLTGIVPLGARVKLTHAAATKYFIVTAVSATTVTLYGGTSYTLAATAITAPFFSQVKAPLGFPLDPNVWTELLNNAVDQSQANAVSGTWYNPGALSLAIPIGAWRVEFQGNLYLQDASHSAAQGKATLSTANNSETDTQFTTYFNTNDGSVAPNTISAGFSRSRYLLLAAKTSYFANAQSSNGFNTTTVILQNSVAPLIIRATSAYL